MTADAMLERIEAFNQEHGVSVVVRRGAQGHALFSERSGGAIARLRPTGEADKVQVLWWNGEG